MLNQFSYLIMKSIKIFRATAALLLGFVIFLSANVAKAQYHGYGVFDVSQTPSNSPSYYMTTELSSNNSQIDIISGVYWLNSQGQYQSDGILQCDLGVYIQVKDPNGNVVQTTGAVIYAGENRHSYSTGYYGSLPGYTYQIVGLSRDTDDTGRPFYFNINPRPVN